jgi:hypothetical protein
MHGLLGGYDDETHSQVDESGRLVVEDVKADSQGGAELGLSGGYRLFLFPAGSCGEYWRLFRPGSGQKHFVVGAEEVGEQ